MDWLYVIVGLVILVFAGDSLVKGAVNLALRLGIPPLVVGLTVVAFGTSAPELLVSLQALFSGQTGIALGNVVGSNTANILLVLGMPALIHRLHSGAEDVRRSYVIMLLASLLFVALLFTGPLTWWHGLILLSGLCYMLFDSWRAARDHREAEPDPEELEGADPNLRGWKIALFIGMGLVGLPFGANLLVGGASNIASAFGVSDAVIGLTLVAIGTSLPELAATMMAALRRQADVALGNVIGSNVFNLLAIIGITTLFGDLPVPPEMLRLDVWVMLAASLALAPFVFKGLDITRRHGTLFTTLYVAYLLVLVFA